MVFVPASPDDALALHAGADIDERRGCAATQTLRSDLGSETTLEEAEFAALNNAGVLALLGAWNGRRLVIAAEVEPRQVSDLGGQYGEVTISGLCWSQVQALFGDEPDASEAVAAARRAVFDGQDEPTLAAALDVAEVAELLNTYDLLWFAPDEVDQLGGSDDLTETVSDRAD
jgi:hypothetical protein